MNMNDQKIDEEWLSLANNTVDMVETSKEEDNGITYEEAKEKLKEFYEKLR